MPNLTPTPAWGNVMEWDQVTPLLGGPGGPLNVQAQALLNRTELLNGKAPISAVDDFGAVGNGVADDTDALNDAAAAASSTGRPLYIKPGRQYRFSQLVIPSGVNVFAAGAVFRSDGSLTVASDLTVDIGDGCRLDALTISTPGTETNTDILRIGNDVQIGVLSILADSQRAGGGVIAYGQDVAIEVMYARKIDRPIHLNCTSTTTQATGSYIGYLDVKDYVRGFRADFCSFTAGDMHMSGRSANASKSPGHNSVLIVGCSKWHMGNLWLGDAGEHAFRVGGSPGAYASSSDFFVGDIVADSCGGCAVKINPTFLVSAGVTEKASRFSIGNVVGIDCGDGSLAGNEELLRLTHVRHGRISSALAYKRDESLSAQYALQINDCDDVTIGVLGGDSLNAGFITIDGTSDVDGSTTFGGDVTNLRIGRLAGACAGNNAIGVSTAFNVGNIFIADADITGFATNVLLWSTGTLTGAFDIRGRVTGGVAPVVSGAPASANMQVDLRYQAVRHTGRPDAMRFPTNAAWQLAVPSFDPSNTLPSQFFLNAQQGTAGSGNYGGGWEFSRIGSGRRGGAVALKQFGASAQNTGIELLVGDPNTATDALLSALAVTHERALQVPDGITAPATRAGWASIYVDTADGDLKVKFGDGTVKTIVVDT